MTSKPIKVLYSIARKAFQSAGLDLVRKGAARGHFERLRLAKELGFQPHQILDGGAFQGMWAKEASALFPNSAIVLIEPNPLTHVEITRNIRNIVPSPILLNVALGAEQGKGRINIWKDGGSDPGASLLSHVSGSPASVLEVKLDTVDCIVERLSFMPDLLKLDLQGGEFAALQGASTALRHTEFVILEFGCLEAYINRSTPRQLIDIMYDNDYCLYDIVDCHNRPYDDALVGGDFFFVKKTSTLRSFKGYI